MELFLILIIIILVLLIFILFYKNRCLNKRLLKVKKRADKMYQKSIRDLMTGVYNCSYILEYLKKNNHSYSLLMLDIDDFKEFNDNYGHQIGDKVIKTVAKRAAANLRETDLIGRYGGDEFIIILANCNKKETELVIEKIKKFIEAPYCVSEDLTLEITVSIGYYVNSRDEKVENILFKADQALYKSKNNGKEVKFKNK